MWEGFGAEQDEQASTRRLSREVVDLDHLSDDLYSSTPAIVRSPDPAALREISERLFGRPLSVLEVAELVGAPGRSEVKIEANKETITVDVSLRGARIDLDMLRTFRRVNGKTIVEADRFKVRRGPQGTGLVVFNRQVSNYAEIGLDRIETMALGSPGSKKTNGYYTWPRFGYNMPLDVETMTRLHSDTGIYVEDLNDLMLYPQGPGWWRVNGRSGSMVFRLDKGSRSYAILRSYKEEKGLNSERK